MTKSPSDTIAHADFLPGKDEMFAQIEEICSWGIRRPGYPADRKTEDYALEQFRALGLENVHKEAVEFPVWEPLEHTLTVTSAEGVVEVECFPLPHSALDVDEELELVLYDAANPGAVKGHAALVPLSLMEAPATLPATGEGLEDLKKVTPIPINPSGTVVDPGGTLNETVQVLPFTPLMTEVMVPAQMAGASAFIGILNGHPGDICEYYVPYDGEHRDFPGVWIKGSSGAMLQDLLNKGPAQIKIRIRARREPDVAYNIIGELAGADEQVVLIGSHHDAPWASAVEDGSGIAMVLAQAQYWAQVPATARPHKLKFILQAGHMVAGRGGTAFVEDHADELKDIVLEVHLEHTANEIRQGKDGVELTGHPETRWFFTSRNPDLEKSVIDALNTENIDRSLVIAPDVFGDRPTTDGGMYHVAGVPLVNFLTAPVYLFDPLDTPDKIHKDSLESISKATVRIINSTAGVSAKQMRDGIRKA